MLFRSTILSEPLRAQLGKKGHFCPIFDQNPIVVAILVIATRLPFVPIKSITFVEEISIQKTTINPYFLSRYGVNLAKKGNFYPFFHQNLIVVAILVSATRVPFAAIKSVTCVEEIRIQNTSTAPYFLSHYGLNLAKKAIFAQFFTKIQS